METTLIDEREFVAKYVDRIKAMNANHATYLNEKAKEAGINLCGFAGGLTTVFCSDKDSLEGLLNNLLAIYGNNFAHFVFAHCESLRQNNMLRIVGSYLESKGLVDDFTRYKTNQTKTERETDRKAGCPYGNKPIKRD